MAEAAEVADALRLAKVEATPDGRVLCGWNAAGLKKTGGLCDYLLRSGFWRVIKKLGCIKADLRIDISVYELAVAKVEALLLSLTAGRLLRPRPAGDEPADHAPALPPMATGVAVYYAGAEGTAARQHEAEGASFELGPATCWEQLSRDLLRELASARGHPGAVQCGPGARGAGGPEEVDVGGAGAGCRGDGCVAWLVATDSSGAHVDLLSQRASPLPGPERWPLSVRAVPVRGEAAPPGEAPIEVPAGPGAAGGAAALGRAPPGARWRAWAELLGLRHCSFPKGDEYDRLSQEQNQWTELIRTDVARTFAWLSEADKQVLRRVLNACAAHCPDVGYCQGMNLVAGALLYASASVPETPEEEILGALTALLQRLGLRGFYSEGLPLLRCYLEAGDQLLRELAPALREHLRDEGVDVRMYLQQWLMALFVDCVPLQVAAGLWDAILLEGLPFALRAAVGLLRSLEGAAALPRDLGRPEVDEGRGRRPRRVEDRGRSGRAGRPGADPGAPPREPLLGGRGAVRASGARSLRGVSLRSPPLSSHGEAPPRERVHIHPTGADASLAAVQPPRALRRRARTSDARGGGSPRCSRQRRPAA
ncbi:unnamed protein product, partial [Prorocentrum cordatum]